MNNLLNILILLLTSCLVDKSSRFERAYHQELTDKELEQALLNFFAPKEQAFLNFLAPPVVICIENKDIKELPNKMVLKEIKNLNIKKETRFKCVAGIEPIIFNNILKELGRTSIRRETSDFVHDYLLTLHVPLQWINNYLKNNDTKMIAEDTKVSKNIKNIENIIFNNKYINAINYAFSSSNSPEEKEALRKEALMQIKECREELYDKDDKESRKYMLSFSSEEIQKMADDSGMSGIVYEIKVEEGVSYLYGRLIISKRDINN